MRIPCSAANQAVDPKSQTVVLDISPGKVLKVLAMLVFCSHSMSADSEGVAVSPHNFLLLLFFEKCFYSVPLAGLELMAFLLRQPPEYWDYGYELPHLAETSVLTKYPV